MKKPIQIAPSMLAADFSKMGEEVQRVEAAGADLFHLDVMDGHFVPNFAISPQMIYAIRKYTDLPFDVHLMISNPQDYIDTFADAGADFITFHIETDAAIRDVINRIRARELKVGLALCPKTPISAVEPYLSDIDLVLPMSVEPGFGGQKFIPATLEKLERLQGLIQARGVDVEVEMDGGINAENAPWVAQRGATILVAGSAIFKSDDLRKAIQDLRSVAS